MCSTANLFIYFAIVFDLYFLAWNQVDMPQHPQEFIFSSSLSKENSKYKIRTSQILRNCFVALLVRQASLHTTTSPRDGNLSSNFQKNESVVLGNNRDKV